MLLNNTHLHLYGFTERLSIGRSGLQRKHSNGAKASSFSHSYYVMCCFFIIDYWGMSLCLLSGTAVTFIMQLSDPLIKKKSGRENSITVMRYKNVLRKMMHV